MKRPWKAVIIVVVIAVLALGAWRATSFFGGLFDDLFAGRAKSRPYRIRRRQPSWRSGIRNR